MRKNTRFVFAFSLTIAAFMAASEAFAQDTISLGRSINQVIFQGTGTQVIKVVWQNCSNTGCTLEGSASRGNDLPSAGTYKFSSPSPVPFQLASTAVGLFSVTQSSEISFSYTSPHGSAVGLAHFNSVVQNPGGFGVHLTGTLQVTGGTYRSYFTAGPGNIYITVAVGKQNLSTLVDASGSINGEIDYPSTVAPPSSCRSTSIIPFELNAPPVPHGQYVWFVATFNASEVDDQTFLQFERAFIQLQLNGQTYMLHIPDAVVTFSSSARCASTRFSTNTDTWETTVPLGESDEIFLSGFAYPVPATGLPGGLGRVTWSESFASNTPNASIQWKWRAEIFSSFSSDYNVLEVKPTTRNACLPNNGDSAGTPERFSSSQMGDARRAGTANHSHLERHGPN